MTHRTTTDYAGVRAGNGRGLTLADLAAAKRLSAEFLRGLGLADMRDGGVAIPYYGPTGEDIATKRRTAMKATDGSFWPRGVPLAAYGQWRLDAAAKAGFLIVVEGESDCWALWCHGLPALGIPGAGATKTLTAEHLVGIAKLYVVREPGQGGEQFAKGIAKRLAVLEFEGVAFEVRMPGGIKDPSDLHIKNPDTFLVSLQDAIKTSTEIEFRRGDTCNRLRPAGADDHAPAEIHLTDEGNAQRLVRRHGQDLRYCHPWKKWLVWDGRRWAEDVTGEVYRRAKDTLADLFRKANSDVDRIGEGLARTSDAGGVDLRRQLQQATAVFRHCLKSEAAQRIKAMIDLARSEPGIPVLPAEMDRERWALNCTNGTIDLRTGQLREHRRSDLITKLCPTAYDPQATAPTWEALLSHILCTPEMIRYVQQLFGYFLTGEIREHLLAVAYGVGQNGKSTLVNAILAMLGEDYAIKAPRDLFMANKNDKHPTLMARLFGKRLVLCVETHEGARLDEGVVKELTGGDPITGRGVFENYWQFDPTHKAMIITNHKPVIRGTDEGIWRRVRLIPFVVCIPKDRQDTELLNKLKNEMPGILAWCVRGCIDWQQHGLGDPQEVTEATAEYRSDQDMLATFVAERCMVQKEARAKASAIYATFCQWCKANGEDEVSQRTFGMALRERGYARKRGTGGAYWWHGIGVPEVNDE